MPYFYKVPAIREYEEIDKELVKSVEERGPRPNPEPEPERKVVAIRPDFPPGVSYTCKLIDDTFIVRTERPVRAKGFSEAESLVHSEARAERKDIDVKRVAVAESKAIEQLRRSFSSEVNR